MRNRARKALAEVVALSFSSATALAQAPEERIQAFFRSAVHLDEGQLAAVEKGEDEAAARGIPLTAGGLAPVETARQASPCRSRVHASDTRRPVSKSSTTRISRCSWSLYTTSMLTPAVAIRRAIFPSCPGSA